MLTGSMASNFWGIPRTTHHLDFVLSFEEDRVTALVSAFEEDYALEAASVRRAFRKPHMFARRLRVTLFGEPAWIATAEDTLLHKLCRNRITPAKRQLGDAAGIVAVQGAELDRSYLEQWASELGVVAVLSDLLDGKIRPKST